MKIYNYHPITFELINQTEARKDPLFQERYLIPAHATDQKPPIEIAHQKAVFDTQAKKWKLVADYRGVNYWLGKGAKVKKYTIMELAMMPPEEASLTKPITKMASVVKTFKHVLKKT